MQEKDYIKTKYFYQIKGLDFFIKFIYYLKHQVKKKKGLRRIPRHPESMKGVETDETL